MTDLFADPKFRTPERDRPHCSRQCKHAEHDLCGGYYDTGGSAGGYDTFLCLCACHRPAGATP